MLESAACLLGLATVVLLTRQVRVGWLLGMVAALLGVALYAQQRFYSQMLLNLGYFGLQWYGWARWEQAGGAGPVRRVGLGQGLQLLLALGPALALAALMDGLQARHPLADASITVYSMLAQFWMAHRYRESWLLFGVVDAAAALLMAHSGLLLMAGLFALYTLLAGVGYLSWRA